MMPDEASPSITINLDMLRPVLEMQQNLATNLTELKKEIRRNSMIHRGSGDNYSMDNLS